MLDIEDICQKAQALGASDVLVSPDMPVRIRVAGALQSMGSVLSAKDTQDIVKVLAGSKYDEYLECGEADISMYMKDNIRCRVNIYKAMGKDCCAIRILASSIPQLSSLGLPSSVASIPNLRRGLVLVTGETGSGKSTTLASLINIINQTQAKHVITFEDPVEYVYEPCMCCIEQREVGSDTASFLTGLRASLRQDPDVILIGEMRDKETIKTALVAAETGHLVFATLHTLGASKTINRILSPFEGGLQQQIKDQLADSLQVVISQQLVPKTTTGRVCACEVMVVNSGIRNLIRTGDTSQIENMLSLGSHDGSVAMDKELIRLAQAGTISSNTALSAAFDKDVVTKALRL